MLITSTRTCAIPTGYDREHKTQSKRLLPFSAATCSGLSQRTLNPQQAATLNVLFALLIVLASGCAQKPKQVPAVTGIEPWRWQNVEGHIVTTPHYRLYTTVDDTAVLDRMARLLEGAYAEYVKLAPPLPQQSREVAAMQVYLFDDPAALEAFTRKLAGKEADVYLSVGTGGYTYDGKVVCYLGSEADTFGTLAHEGLHQYIGENFRNRLPPTIEEGLACTFESVTVLPSGDVKFDLTSNPRRSQWLARAHRDKTLIPLDTLIYLHGGDLAGRPLALVEGYYGQCWALARMLRNDPAYAERFKYMLTAVQTGRTVHDVGRSDAPDGAYNPRAIRPLLQRYVAEDWARFTADVNAAVVGIAQATQDDGMNPAFPAGK